MPGCTRDNKGVSYDAMGELNLLKGSLEMLLNIVWPLNIMSVFKRHASCRRGLNSCELQFGYVGGWCVMLKSSSAVSVLESCDL